MVHYIKTQKTANEYCKGCVRFFIAHRVLD